MIFVHIILFTNDLVFCEVVRVGVHGQQEIY